MSLLVKILDAHKILVMKGIIIRQGYGVMDSTLSAEEGSLGSIPNVPRGLVAPN